MRRALALGAAALALTACSSGGQPMAVPVSASPTPSVTSTTEPVAVSPTPCARGRYEPVSATFVSRHVLLLVEVRHDLCDPPAQKLWRSADDGRHWSDVTPAHLRPGIEQIGTDRADQVWFTTWNCGDSNSQLWHSSDDARTWQQESMPFSHSCHAGARFDVQFLRGGRIGFVTTEDPTGPIADVARTVDGGRHWSDRPSSRGEDNPTVGLPAVGPTTWTSSTTGFQVGRGYPPGSRYASTVDATHWRVSRPVVVPGYDEAHTTYSLPTFFTESAGVMEVTVRSGTKANALVYRTYDGGAQWRLAARSPCVVDARGRDYVQESVVFAPTDSDTWWLMTPYGTAAANQLYETCATADGGRTWLRSKPPTRRQNGDVLSAADGHTAVVAVSAEIATVYLTVDGRTWRPLTLPS